jgi:hypothetical protein
MSGIQVIQLVCIVVAGVLAGNEIATMLIHTSGERLKPNQRVPVTQYVFRVMARFVPVLMPAVIILSVVLAIVKDGMDWEFYALAAALVLSASVLTFARVLPLNVRILHAREDAPLADCSDIRAQ